MLRNYNLFPLFPFRVRMGCMWKPHLHRQLAVPSGLTRLAPLSVTPITNDQMIITLGGIRKCEGVSLVLKIIRQFSPTGTTPLLIFAHDGRKYSLAI